MDSQAIENLILTYKYIAVISTVLFVIKFLIFSVTSGDGTEVSSDFTSISDTDASFDFFSIQSILAFLMGFGWIGLASLAQWHISVKYAVVISSLTGFAFLYMSAFLMFKIKSLNQIVQPEYEKCTGNVGKAYTTIHANSEGQIQLEINGKLSVINAVNGTDSDIKAFEQIKVIKYENSKLYIEKDNKS